jgi:hypothetical protein
MAAARVAVPHLMSAPPGGETMALHTYRVRIFDGPYEVLHNRTFLVAIDLQSPSLSGALYSELALLTSQAEAANEPMDRPRLELWDGDVKILDWA